MAKNGMKVKLDDRRLRAMPDALRKEGEKLVKETAMNIETRMKVKIQHGPKTGKIYTHGNVTHQASAPGEPPATDTGYLATAMAVEATKDPLTKQTNVYAEYGGILEQPETQEHGKSHIAPRPFMQPSFDDEEDSFKKGVNNLIKKAHRRV